MQFRNEYELEQRVRCKIKISFACESSFWGPGIAELLHRIKQVNSIRTAAREIGISYSKAWKILHTAEDSLGIQLVDTLTGGVKGGGSYLTEEAKEILNAYDQMQEELNAEMQHAYEVYMKPIFRELAERKYKNQQNT